MTRRVLFISSNRIGDAILSTGILHHLVHSMPDARFTIACGPVCVDLFAAVPRLDRMISLRKKSWNRHWIGLWLSCVGTRWDLVVDLRNSVISRLLWSKRRVSRAGGAELHKVLQNASVLGLNPPPSPFNWIGGENLAFASQHLPKDVPILAVGPAANWPAKQWPIENVIAFVQRATSASGLLPDAHVMILAAESERAQIQPLLDSISSQRRIELIGTNLRDAAACLAHASLFVGNDSGLMHLAAAAGAPTLGLFGPGWEKIYGPWGAHTAVVRTPEGSQELLDRLPYPGAFAPNLMGSLSVEAVDAAARQLLLKIRQSSCATQG